MVAVISDKQPSWRQLKAEFILAYRAVRRARAGFHSVRPARIQLFFAQHREERQKEYNERINLATSRYPLEVKRIRGVNAQLRADYEAACARRALLIDSVGEDKAIQIIKADHWSWIDLYNSPWKIPTLSDFLSNIEELEVTIAKERKNMTRWGVQFANWSPPKQYEAIIVSRAANCSKPPRIMQREAYAKAREFHLAANASPKHLARLLSMRKVPESRSHALPTTGLAKLIVGETVRIPKGTDSDGRPRYVTQLWWDDRLVNKVASMIALMEAEGVPPGAVPEWISSSGGVQACIARYRAP